MQYLADNASGISSGTELTNRCEGAIEGERHLGSSIIYELDPLTDERWEEFIRYHPHSSVFHSRNWLQALRSAYEYDPVVITTCSPRSRLTNGLAFCRVSSRVTGRRYVSLPFSDHCEPLVSNSAELDEILVQMKPLVDEGGWKYVEIRPSVSAPSSRTGLTQTLRYWMHRLDLSKTTAQLFSSFHADCVRRAIRRATREKLGCREGRSEDLLQDFYNLVVMTRRRQSLPPQPESWFRTLLTSFGASGKLRIAYKHEVPVSGILTLSHNKTMVYKYGCSNARFNSYGGMALLFWDAIQEAKNDGYEEFDMGRSDHDSLGLIAFKERWGAKRSGLTYWTYPHRPQADYTTLQKRLIRSFVAVSPAFALKAAGNALYRHIG